MKLFSLYHFLYLLICASICVGFYFIFRNKSKKVKFIATYVPIALAFVIHFLKLLIPIYIENLPYSLVTITFESLCAISTLTFPFIYFSKSTILKNYMVVMGIASGILTLLLPLESSAFPPFSIETIRFFYAHLAILMTPLFMYIFDIYRPKGKWIKHFLLLLLLFFYISYLNNIAFTFILEGKESGMNYLRELNIIE